MKRLLFVSLAWLAGCATTPVPSVTAVPTPVQCPTPTPVAKPRLPIEQLKPGAAAEEVLAAYAEALNLCIARNRALEQTLNGYTHE